MLITVVRSLVAAPIQLPGETIIRPGASVTLRGTLGDETKRTLRVLERAHLVDLSQICDGACQRTVDLDRRYVE